MTANNEPSGLPQDPAFEKVRRKMVRLLALSIAVLFVGLIAVLSAVVYRSGGRGSDAEAPTTPVAALLPIPLGGRVTLATGISPDRALVVVDAPEGFQELVVFNPSTGTLISRIRLDPDGS
ncbi:hypothetical protein [Aureimonas sp. ME7]|uniref:hypothetical protein n=1 Tax=Aureimonas sp. ME7 TaxID=2744252 RepID=UPI0015F5C5E7|nr:hypothetical protein [Aureimonas sp. ME7]